MNMQKQAAYRNGRSATSRPVRHGLAAAELAVCLPIIVLILLASIEACSAVFLKHSLTVATYEGVRVALDQNGTSASVKAKCEEILSDRRVKGAAIKIKPASVETLSPGEYIDVTITAPCSENAIVPVTFYRGRSMSATASMMIEY